VKVRIGLSTGVPAPATLEAFAALLEGLESRGFDSLWLPEVLTGATIDNLVGLAWAAGRTSKLKLGTHVSLVGRNPFRLAKELATLDRLSGGRLLLMAVIGLPDPAELEALGVTKAGRSAEMEETLGLLRRFWAGEAVDHDSDRFHYASAVVEPRPVQEPLEFWLGGVAPAALERAGRVSDGYMPPSCSPAEAVTRRATVVDAATRAGRSIDEEHFGMNVLYARDMIPRELAERLARRSDAPVSELVPVGEAALVAHLHRFIDVGYSKFVVRPATPPTDWDEELDYLAQAVLGFHS